MVNVDGLNVTPDTRIMTVPVDVAVKPPSVVVTVIVTVPADVPLVTRPDMLTVATV